MPLPDLLPILPFPRPVRGTAAIPGSKSLTNRALILAALGSRPVTLTGALFSEDTEIMARALRALGFGVEEEAGRGTIRVEGLGGQIPAETADLQVGLAGTAARFLTALCAAAPRGQFRLDGVPQMRKRPMRGLIEALRSLGADIRCPGEEGFFPLEIQARGLAGGKVAIDASESSQLLSALLMVAPLARQEVDVDLAAGVREPFVEMTVQLMRRFGVDVGPRPGGFRVPRAPYGLVGAGVYAIEPDATAASYFLALPLAVGGSLTLPHFQDASLQGDLAFVGVLRAAGLAVEFGPAGLTASSGGGPRPGLAGDFRGFSDTFLTLAALAPLLEGPTTISGIAHTRKQETDRVAGMARELRRLGQQVVETADTLEIHPRPLQAGMTVETYGDHRFAMSFAILGCHDLTGDGRPWLTVRDPGCCAKTFPTFFAVLESLRQSAASP
jgi:3-phosphoshikimate 1-carboxyvinyltransferase